MAGDFRVTVDCLIPLCGWSHIDHDFEVAAENLDEHMADKHPECLAVQ